MPACIISCTAPGSHPAKAATPSSPASRMPASTVMVSIVPPEAQLSLWSSSTTGPASGGRPARRACARFIESAGGSIG